MPDTQPAYPEEKEEEPEEITRPGGILHPYELDWGREYTKCPRFSSVWQSTQDPQAEWPEKVRLYGDKLYEDDRLCVPSGFQKEVIIEHHYHVLHVGGERFWQHLTLRFVFANSKKARDFAMKITSECTTCQACDRPRNLKGPLGYTVIPPAIMPSVAIDIFHVEGTHYAGQYYDSFVACVDRHSGWIVAVPCQNKGLTGGKVAQAMFEHQWRLFGTPAIISSDQGSHFVSAWWQTLCSLMGIRHAFSQAYHHQANGRAERAGQQILERLRKLQIHEKVNWVEALPRVLDRIHDLPGETGLSPYEILFGRTRPLSGLPLPVPHECEDAMQFFKRMADTDEKVARQLNETH